VPHTKYDTFINGLIIAGEEVADKWIKTRICMHNASGHDYRTSDTDQIVNQMSQSAKALVTATESFLRELNKYNRVHYKSSDID
jgi:hypothetical protein